MSRIEWTDRTWNPVRGCSRVSEGCRNCYAERMAARFSRSADVGDAWDMGQPFRGYARMTPQGPRWTGRVKLIPEKLYEPLHWRKPRRVFVNSMSDLFHEALSDEAIARVWQVMGCAPEHTYQILTKRAERMRSWVSRWYSGEIPEPYEVRPVAGYPGYSVTTRGEVLGKRADTLDGLSPDASEQGYLRVTMHRDGSPKNGERELVHRLVLTAFARPARAGEQACHRNGEPGDNRLSNLYWGSQEDNWDDRIRHGHGRAYSKLTEEDIAAIRRRCASGESAYRVASDYPVSDTQVRNITSGRQWVMPPADPAVRAPARARLSSVWLGVSPHDQESADRMVPLLLQTPAAVRFLSFEPCLGPVDFVLAGALAPPDLPAFAPGTPLCSDPLCGRSGPHYPREFGCRWGKEPSGSPGVDWVIVGGESGPGARPCDVAWIRSVLRQCREAGVPAFCKQLGARPRSDADDDPWPRTGQGVFRLKSPKGGDPSEWPEDLRVREMPE